MKRQRLSCIEIKEIRSVENTDRLTLVKQSMFHMPNYELPISPFKRVQTFDEEGDEDTIRKVSTHIMMISLNSKDFL